MINEYKKLNKKKYKKDELWEEKKIWFGSIYPSHILIWFQFWKKGWNIYPLESNDNFFYF